MDRQLLGPCVHHGSGWIGRPPDVADDSALVWDVDFSEQPIPEPTPEPPPLRLPFALTDFCQPGLTMTSYVQIAGESKFYLTIVAGVDNEVLVQEMPPEALSC